MKQIDTVRMPALQPSSPAGARAGAPVAGSGGLLPHALRPNPEILQRAADVGIKLVSFDVFDTVLTRRLGAPEAVFYHLGQVLASTGETKLSPEAFSEQRLAAERRARRNHMGREVTLRMIYEEFAYAFPSSVERLVEAELQLEAAAIQAVGEMVRTVEAVRQRFGRVIYISDMYLPADFLEGQLRHHGLWGHSDRLYVSSAYGGWKGDGRLYRTVLSKESLKPRQLLHCGNSLAADVIQAQRLGIRAHHYTPANPNASEELMNTHVPDTQGLSSLASGVSRTVRLLGASLAGDARTVWETGASVTGPLVWIYARWIIERASDLGVTRLLFLARDAYLPYLAVKRLLEARPRDALTVTYLHGSRATYLPLDVETLGKSEWDRLTAPHGTQTRTLRGIKDALAARDQTFIAHLSPLGFGPGQWELPLTEAQLAAVKRHALADATFNQALLADIRAFQQLTREYLLERGVPGPGASALVDTGWSTLSHGPLHRFLTAEGCRPLHLFYFAMHGTRADVPAGSLHTFLYNRADGLGSREPWFEYPRALETLLMAPHGRTRGFVRTESGVAPVLDREDNPEFLSRHFNSYADATLRFVDIMARQDLPTPSFLVNERPLADALIRRFWLAPTRSEAVFWATQDWEADAAGHQRFVLSRPYRFADAWAAFRSRRFPSCHRQFWVDAAIALTPRPQLLALKAAILLRRAIGSVTRTPRRALAFAFSR